MTTINYPNTTLINTNGNTGTSITSTSITTPSLITTNINNSNVGSTGKILSTNGSYLTWIVVPPPSISFNTNSNINNVKTLTCTNLNATTISGTITFANQSIFNIAPISNDPTNINQLATKSYTDSIITQFNYKLKLYFNISQIVSTGIYTLNTVMTNTSTLQLSYTSSSSFSDYALGNFITNLSINTTTIPECLCKFIGYFITSSASVTVYYTICKFSSNNVSTVLKRSNNFVLNNVNSARLIHIYTRLPQTTLSVSDRLQIIIYASCPTLAATTVKFTSENNVYSYIELESNRALNLFPIITNLYLNKYNIGTTGNSISINTQNNTQTITLGPATNIIINGNTGGNINLTPTNNIQIYKPLYPLYELPINTYKIGYTSIITSLTPIILSSGGGSNTIYTFVLPYAGVTLYSVTCGLDITSTNANPMTNVRCRLTTSGNAILGEHRQQIPHINNIGINNVLNFSAIGISTNATTSYIITISMTQSGAGYSASSTSTYFRLQYCRIA